MNRIPVGGMRRCLVLTQKQGLLFHCCYRGVKVEALASCFQ